jgi:flagellar basal-body rod protein FlgG
VLGQNGQALRVTGDGTVAARQLGVFNLDDARKVGDGLFTGTAAGRGTGQVRDGMIEASGVDPARTMVDMMASLRAYEAGQKVLTTIDSTLEKAASQIGRT